MGKKQKKFYLTDYDVELLEHLKKEFEKSGLSLNESDLVSMGLRQIEKQGGVFETLKLDKEEKAS